MNGDASVSPFEALTGAIFEEVAAPAVRPLRRGRRSRNASCRRWDQWHARVSQTLVSLIPKIPFVVDTKPTLPTPLVHRDVSPEVSCKSPPPAHDSILGQSGEESSFKCCKSLGFNVLLVNVRSINSRDKRAMLSVHLERFSPDIVVLNEIWFDDSAPRLDVPNYRCVSR